MSNKSEPEKATENTRGKSTAKKGPARKTIRRVRKAAPRRVKDPGPENQEPVEETIPLAETSPERTEAPKPDAADSIKATDAAEPRPRPEKDSEKESRDEARPKRSGGRVRKESSEEGKGNTPRQDAAQEDRRSDRRGRVRRGNRPKQEPVDPKKLACKAWKLYQADIAEEGIALVDDKAGRHLALRSFDLARIFLEEKSKQDRNAGGQPEPQGNGDE